MTTSSRALKHLWSKEEESTLVECLVELVSTRRWKSDNCTFWPVTWPNWPSQKYGGQRVVGSIGTMTQNA
ncbi:retrotransposon protein [Cucumis melo var. makuwa]|uniref:Retrotransposon protein n=1 Tax=Cucumis melo var. makuwa TaxID=1194695 RepID=A0A5A7T0G3_CUCMM|nr:retrotransposon protein [Cucumis melo var. makuwa]TYK21221.1 retrotransposon protein [Cucumis melo var. makuwa]